MHCRGIYTRLFQRKGPWFRVENILSYEELLIRWDESITPEERSKRAQKALAELEHFGYLSGIREKDLSCDDITLLEGIENCFRSEELKPLIKRFCLKSASGLARHEVMRELRRGLCGQRTLGSFFSPSTPVRATGTCCLYLCCYR